MVDTQNMLGIGEKNKAKNVYRKTNYKLKKGI